MDSPITLLDEVLLIYPRLQTGALVGLACATWQFHDWVLTFQRERHLIWTKKFSGGSALYVILRFYSFFFTFWDFIIEITRWTSVAFCKYYCYEIAISTCFLIGIVQALLQGRVYALYRADKRLLWGNLAIFVLALIGNALILWHYLPQSQVVIVPEPLVGCWISVPRHIIFSYFPSLALETWLCFLLVRRAFSEAHVQGAWPATGTTILSVMVRDYTAWVVVGIICTLANIFTFLYAPLGHNYSGIGIFHSCMAVGGCRMILNIRGAYYNEANSRNETGFSAGPMKFEGGKSATSATATRMHFATTDTTTMQLDDLEAAHPDWQVDDAGQSDHDGLTCKIENVLQTENPPQLTD